MANLGAVEDFPARFASLLESVATKVRSLTVDRAAKAIRLTALGLMAATLGLLAVVFLFATIYGALEIPLGASGAFATIGGLFLIGGALLWRRRRGQQRP
jgi:hypothetical protein